MNNLDQALIVDPVAEAVFIEHGLSPTILNHIKIETSARVGSPVLVGTLKNGIRIINAAINQQTLEAFEDPGELVHKIAHLLLDRIATNDLAMFVTDTTMLSKLDSELKRAATSIPLQAIHRAFLPQYRLAFSDPKVAERYFNEKLRLAATQLHKLEFSPEENDVLNKIRVAAVETKCKAYLVGGCIRDKLLGLENHDLDFMVITEDLQRFVKYVVQKYSLREAVHLERSDAFTLRIGEIDVDLIEARKVYTPLRSFEETSLEGDEEFTVALDDAFRRDLTINSLMYDLNNNEVIDPTKRGFKDLQDGIVNSIIDPYVKYRINAPDMLRALRFAAVFNFKLGPEMLKAMQSNATRLKPRDKGGDISKRRIRRELRKAAEKAESWYRFKRFVTEAGLIDYLADDMKDVEDDRIGTSPKDIEKNK